MGFYIYICSEEGNSLFTNNKYHSFRTQLPRYVNLPGSPNFGWRGEWHVALVDFSLSVNNQRLNAVPSKCIVLCDLVNASIYNAGTAQILRIIQSDADLTISSGCEQYHPIKSSSHSFNQIEIKLKTEKLEELGSEWPQAEATKLYITLHFTRV